MNKQEIEILRNKNRELISDHINITKTDLNSPITGQIPNHDIVVLKNIIDVSSAEHILEIGFNVGSSTIMWLMSNPKTIVHAIDIHNPQKSVEKIKELYPNRFTFQLLNSNEIGHGEFLKNNKDKYDLIFIDADHSEKAVINDLNNALKLNPKYIVFDDVNHPSHVYIKQIILNCDKIKLIELYDSDLGIALVKVI